MKTVFEGFLHKIQPNKNNVFIAKNKSFNDKIKTCLHNLLYSLQFPYLNISNSTRYSCISTAYISITNAYTDITSCYGTNTTPYCDITSGYGTISNAYNFIAKAYKVIPKLFNFMANYKYYISDTLIIIFIVFSKESIP